MPWLLAALGYKQPLWVFQYVTYRGLFSIKKYSSYLLERVDMIENVNMFFLLRFQQQQQNRRMVKMYLALFCPCKADRIR